jgi:hypothetical protein
MTIPADDPFASFDKAPSLSFKNQPVGTTYVGTVTAAPHLVRSRDYDTGQLASWDDGNPKWSVVTRIEISGSEYDVWAAKPSALFRALSDAQQRAGQQIAVGGRLQITYTGEEPNKNPRLNAVKQYSAQYQPPDAFAHAAPGAPSVADDDEPPF